MVATTREMPVGGIPRRGQDLSFSEKLDMGERNYGKTDVSASLLKDSVCI